MLSVYLVVGLALVLAAVYYLVRSSSRPLSPTVSDAAASSPAITDATDALVLVVGPPVAEVIRAGVEFRELYQDSSLVAYSFQVHAVEPGIAALTFPQHLPAEFFYYLINYLTYPESGYGVAAQVRGWATLPIKTRDKAGVPPGLVLVCVPPNDTKYDVVLLVTPTSAVYQVSVGSLLPFALRDALPMTYTPPPYSLEQVRQIPATELR